MSLAKKNNAGKEEIAALTEELNLAKAAEEVAKKGQNEDIAYQMAKGARGKADKAGKGLYNSCKKNPKGCMGTIQKAGKKAGKGLGEMLGMIIPEYKRMVEIDCDVFLKGKK